MSYFPKPSLNENDLAIIERGDTVTHSIEAGQYVSWKGRTGKAKAAILQGATLDDTLFDYDEDGALNVLGASLNQDVTLGTGVQLLSSNTPYTFPKDGLLYVKAGSYNNNVTSCYISDRNNTSLFVQVIAIGGNTFSNIIPVKKGFICKNISYDTAKASEIKYYPYE